jgi:uncharacterized protein involved in oxidation of intracellular sulfur
MPAFLDVFRAKLTRAPAAAPQPSVLVVLSQAPFDGDATWNALRLAGTLVERKVPVRIFVMNDAIDLVRQGATPEGSEFDLQAMLRQLLPKGARLKICTTCVNRCGISHGEVIPEAVMATMGDLAEWILESDRVVVF